MPHDYEACGHEIGPVMNIDEFHKLVFPMNPLSTDDNDDCVFIRNFHRSFHTDYFNDWFEIHDDEEYEQFSFEECCVKFESYLEDCYQAADSIEVKLNLCLVRDNWDQMKRD